MAVRPTAPIVIAAPAAMSANRAFPAATRRPDTGAQIIVMIAIGSTVTPAWSAENPRTSCRYRLFRNRNPA